MSPCHCHISLTGSSSSSSSILSLCITPSLFHSRLKTYLFHKSFPHHSLPYLSGRIWRIFMTISVLNYSSFFVCFLFLIFVCFVSERLSWFNPLLDCTLNSCTFLFFTVKTSELQHQTVHCVPPPLQHSYSLYEYECEL